MKARHIVCAMLAIAAVAGVVVAWPSAPRVEEDVLPATPQDVAWLSKDATSQIIGPTGDMGPLFAGVEIGGPAPSPAIRDRIAAFARANDVAIDFEVTGAKLVAVRFDVTFGGCCGYEGADVLALRLHRPHAQECCGCDKSWIDDWATTSDDGAVNMRARVRFNRVQIRWERAIALPDLFARADALLGKSVDAVRAGAGDRWRELEPGRYLLEVPFAFPDPHGSTRRRDSLGITVGVDGDRIVEATFTLREVDEMAQTTMRERWGHSKRTGETRTWRLADREITAERDWQTRITITQVSNQASHSVTSASRSRSML